MEELKAQLHDHTSLNLKLSTELEVEREDYRPPKDRARHEEIPLYMSQSASRNVCLMYLSLNLWKTTKSCTQQESMPSTPAFEPLKDHDIPDGLQASSRRPSTLHRPLR